jgi:hypothetical protein
MITSITISIISFIIWLIMLVVAIFFVIKKDVVIGFLILYFSLIPICIGTYSWGLDIAFKESLKGKNPYKMEIRTEYRNNVLYKSDTLYVKKGKSLQGKNLYKTEIRTEFYDSMFFKTDTFYVKIKK